MSQTTCIMDANSCTFRLTTAHANHANTEVSSASYTSFTRESFNQVSFPCEQKTKLSKHDSKTSIVRTPMGQLSVPSMIEFPEL